MIIMLGLPHHECIDHVPSKTPHKSVGFQTASGMEASFTARVTAKATPEATTLPRQWWKLQSQAPLAPTMSNQHSDLQPNTAVP